jgi:preprotein translocase subunit SecE
VAEEVESPKPKRRLKKAPESVRERTTKASELAAKEPKIKQPRKIFAPFRAIGRVLRRIERFKPVHILGLVIVPRYVRNAWKELRQVTWPSRIETLRLTSAVIVFSAVFGILIAITDYGLDKLFKKVILKQ